MAVSARPESGLERPRSRWLPCRACPSSRCRGRGRTERVCAGPAHEKVVARTTNEHVVAASAKQLVVAALTVNPVCGGSPPEGLASRRPADVAAHADPAARLDTAKARNPIERRSLLVILEATYSHNLLRNTQRGHTPDQPHQRDRARGGWGATLEPDPGSRARARARAAGRGADGRDQAPRPSPH